MGSRGRGGRNRAVLHGIAMPCLCNESIMDGAAKRAASSFFHRLGGASPNAMT
jgi:hypothetical protein